MHVDTRFAFLVSASVVAATAGCLPGAADDTGTAASPLIGDVQSMVQCPFDNTNPQCPAGEFAVTCTDGSHELDTQDQILANQVCMLPQTNILYLELDGTLLARIPASILEAIAFHITGNPSPYAYAVSLATTPTGLNPAVSVTQIVGSPQVYDCNTFDGGHLDFNTMSIPAAVMLPDAWRNLPNRFFGSCGTAHPDEQPDVVAARNLVLTSVSVDRFSGRYEIVVNGRGPRAGQTLRVHGDIDAVPVL